MNLSNHKKVLNDLKLSLNTLKQSSQQKSVNCTLKIIITKKNA